MGREKGEELWVEGKGHPKTGRCEAQKRGLFILRCILYKEDLGVKLGNKLGKIQILEGLVCPAQKFLLLFSKC